MTVNRREAPESATADEAASLKRAVVELQLALDSLAKLVETALVAGHREAVSPEAARQAVVSARRVSLIAQSLCEGQD